MEARMTKAIPEGFHSVTPFIMIRNADTLIDFLKQAFDAQEISLLKHPSGNVWHAQLKIGDSMIMIGDTMGEHPDAPCSVYLYVPDVDAVYEKALAAGALSLMEPANQFYGDRSAGVKDASGNTWWMGTHIEDVSDAELQRRSNEMVKKKQAA
jgi:PhnB protein